MKHKKLIVGLLLLCVVCSGAFATEQWMGVSFTYEWSQNFNDPQIMTNSLGGEGTSYTYFGDGNVGLRFGFDFSIPFSGSKLENSTWTPISMAEAPMLVSLQLGPTFKYDINSWYTIYGGFGVNVSYSAQGATITDASISSAPIYGQYLDWLYGIVVDLGMRFSIGDSFGIRLGTTLGTNFLQYRSFTAYPSNANGPTSITWADWTNGYVDFGVKPYVGVSASF